MTDVKRSLGPGAEPGDDEDTTVELAEQPAGTAKPAEQHKPAASRKDEQ